MSKPDKDNKNGLSKTLELAGVSEEPKKIISHGYSKDGIKKTHKKTNDLLKKCVENIDSNDLGECIHITGEMRALTDPFHRYICEEISHKEKDIFRIVYNLPKKNMRNTPQIVEWNLNHWNSDNSTRKWYEELRTIYSIANRSVNLFALDTSNEIQYSVFGHKYVLLQEMHKDGQSKHKWLLESESINSTLTTRANNFIKKSTDIDEGNFRRFTQNLSGITATRFLTMLKDNIFSIDELLEDEVAKDFSDTPEEVIDTLKVMNFISSNNDEKIEITSPGLEFTSK